MLLAPITPGGSRSPWLGFGAVLRQNIIVCQLVATDIEILDDTYDCLIYKDEHDKHPKMVRVILAADEEGLEANSAYEVVQWEII